MLYVFFGSDDFSIHEALERLKAEVGPPDVLEGNLSRAHASSLSPQELLAMCNTVPFLASRRIVVVDGLLSLFERSGNPRRGRRNQDRGETASPWPAIVEGIPLMPPSTDLVVVDGPVDVGTAESTVIFAGQPGKRGIGVQPDGEFRATFPDGPGRSHIASADLHVVGHTRIHHTAGHRRNRPEGFQVDRHAHVAFEQIQRFGQCQEPLSPKGLAAPGADVELPTLRQSEFVDEGIRSSRVTQIWAVPDDGHPVARTVGVQLDDVDTQVHGLLKRCRRVFGGFPGVAAVGDHDRSC